jgi:hypothetical protein
MHNPYLRALGLALVALLSVNPGRAKSQALGIDSRPACDPQHVYGAGKPLSFSQRDGVAFGVSLPQRSFLVGEHIPASIWIMNTGAKDYATSTCEMFWSWDIGVWNIAGERIPGYAEKHRQDFQPGTCTRNFAIEVKAHSCRRVSESLLDREFELSPGKYRVGALPTSPSALNSKRDPVPMPGVKESLLFNVSEAADTQSSAVPNPARLHNDSANDSMPLPQVFGRVVRADTGSPIPGVEVHIGNGSPGGCCRPAVTDANGDYSFQGLPDGIYTAAAFADGFVTGDYHCTPGPESVCKDREQHITSASHLEVDFRLLPEASIRGTVVTPEGHPAGGGLLVVAVPVSLVHQGHNGVYSNWAEATTQSDGSFTLRGLPPASYLVRARQMMGGRTVPPPSETHYHEAWYGDTATPAHALPINLKEAEKLDGIRITVTPETRYSIVLWPSGPDGVPLPSEYIVGIPESNTTAVKQPDGSYLIPNVSPGHYSLNIFAPGLPQGVAWLHSAEVDVGKSDATLHLNITAK